MSNTISKKRTDERGRNLNTGESQIKKKTDRNYRRYTYKYKGADGKPKFAYSWRLTDTDPLPKGKRPCKSLRELEKEINRDLMHGIDSTGAKMTVCELYKEHNETQKANVRESTQKGRNQLMKVLQDDKLGNMQIGKVTSKDATEWVKRMKEKGFAYQTINNYKRSLIAIFYTAIERDYVRKNPFVFKTSDVIENDTEEKIALTDKQAELLLQFLQTDCTYNRHYNTVVILLNTGLRISELCGLTVKDIDFENKHINVNHQLIFDKGEYHIEKPKTDSGVRKVPMSESVFRALKDEINNRENSQPVTIGEYTDFVFLNKKGLPMYGSAYSTVFSSMVKKYNKHHKEQLPKISPHTLRHTYCTNIANKTRINPKVLQYIMGHKNFTTTWEHYAHGSAELAKEEYRLLGI